MRVFPPFYPCPCCGFLTFHQIGDYEYCAVCFWQNDLVQLRFPMTPGGANRVSLTEAQWYFQTCGTSDPDRRLLKWTAVVVLFRDLEWRPIDPFRDNIEESIEGVDYGPTYPRDKSRLFYWRETFWRKDDALPL